MTTPTITPLDAYEIASAAYLTSLEALDVAKAAYDAARTTANDAFKVMHEAGRS